jgi:galactose mutarotase-like enzyme
MPMHGFLREKPFAVEQRSNAEGLLRYRSDESTLGIYPFDFSVRIHALLDNEGLVLRYEVENIGNLPMPYSIGSHYNYCVPIVPGERLSDYRIDFFGPQKAGKLDFSEGFIAGKSKDIFNGNSGLNLDGLFLNGAVALELSELSTKKVALRSMTSRIYTAVSMDNFDYLLLWAPGNESPFVCIEAWAGLPDTLGHDKTITGKKGIKILASGEIHRYEQKISIGKDQSR